MRVFGFAGRSNAGKTTMIEALIARWVARGLRVGVIKHAHHGFDIDRPGKDSWRHREAGAAQVLISSGQRWVLMHEVRTAPEPTLAELLQQFAPCDLVLVEGYQRSALPKLEVHREQAGHPWMFPADPSIVGIATDSEPPPLPVLAGRQEGCDPGRREGQRDGHHSGPTDGYGDGPASRPVFGLNDYDAIAQWILLRAVPVESIGSGS
jgi:molybdopterin-guanine dinucleotide biosynthesis protein B